MMQKSIQMSDVDEFMLRAWAEAGVISTARYVEEMQRRAGRGESTRPAGEQAACSLSSAT